MDRKKINYYKKNKHKSNFFLSVCKKYNEGVKNGTIKPED